VGRNASVSTTDDSAARLNRTDPVSTLKYLNLTSALAAPEADGVEVEDGGDEVGALLATDSGDSGMVSVLAASRTTGLTDGVPRCLSNRIDRIDLDSGAPARLFQHLHDAKTLRSRALLQKFDVVADALGLDDELVDLACRFGSIAITSPSPFV